MKHKDTEQLHQEEPTRTLSNGIAPGEIIIGVLAAINDQGQALVSFQENSSADPAIAISTVALSQQQVGRQVALLFADGNPQKPVIMGLIHSPLDDMLESFEIVAEEGGGAAGNHESADKHKENPDENKNPKLPQEDDIYLDGKRVVFEAKEEIVFKCGDASITLTKAGKILIRGKYLLNRSTGVNRIMGGSVQVN